MGQNRPATFSSWPPGLAAQQPTADPPKRPVPRARQGRNWPASCRLPPAVALLGRTKPAAAGTPFATLAPFFSSPRNSRAHTGGGWRSAVAGGQPATARSGAAWTAALPLLPFLVSFPSPHSSSPLTARSRGLRHPWRLGRGWWPAPPPAPSPARAFTRE
jgi:hypothetical protein